MAGKGFNDQGALEKAQTFLRAAIKYQPINMGNALVNSLYRPEKTLLFSSSISLVARKNQL